MLFPFTPTLDEIKLLWWLQIAWQLDIKWTEQNKTIKQLAANPSHIDYRPTVTIISPLDNHNYEEIYK